MDFDIYNYQSINKLKGVMMYKKLTLLFIFFFISGLSFGQTAIQSFDGVADSENFSLLNEGPPSEVVLSDENSDYQEGSGALKVEYKIGAFHPWGSFASLIYQIGEGEPLMNWTGSDTLKIWIKVLEGASQPEYMYFRLHIADRPNADDPLEEYLFESETVLDSESEWFELKMPLVERESDGNTPPNNEGFVLMPLDWGGQRNNGTLDLNAMAGYTLVATTSGWTDPDNIPADSVKVLYDFFNRDGAIIPVELSSFTANANGSDVVLNWETASEKNNNHFVVERKTESNEFQVAGIVEGNGTTDKTSKYSFVDSDLKSGNYTYRLKQIDYDGTFEYSGLVEVNVNAPAEYSLEQNYPNPFNPSTKINYLLKETAQVDLSVYNLLGQKVKTLVNEKKEAGSHTVSFNAGELSNGLYIYKITTSDFTSTKKMLLVK